MPRTHSITKSAIRAVIHIFFKNYGVYCFIVAIISMGIKGKYFGKLKYPFIALLCYYLRFYVLFELNAIRQGMAMAFVIIAIYYLIKETKNRKYVILREIDTILDDIDIICIKKEELQEEYYQILELLKEENLLGVVGYYKDMNELEKYIYKSYMIMFRDEKYELIYDPILDRHFINRSLFEKESFVCEENILKKLRK